MDIQEIEVIVGKDGATSVRVNGAQGTECLDLTRDLEQALGGVVVERVMTPEADLAKTAQRTGQYVGARG